MPLLPQPPAFVPPVIAVPAANGIVPFVAPAAAAVAGSAGLAAGAPIAAAAAAGLGAGLIAGAIAGQLWGVPNNDRNPGTEPPEDSSAGLSGNYSPSGWTTVTATATRVTVWIEDPTAPDGRTLVDVTPSGAAAVNTVALLGPLSFAPNGRYIMYATQAGGRKSLAVVSVDGRVKQRLTTQAGNIKEPTWGPFMQ